MEDSGAVFRGSGLARTPPSASSVDRRFVFGRDDEDDADDYQQFDTQAPIRHRQHREDDSVALSPSAGGERNEWTSSILLNSPFRHAERKDTDAVELSPSYHRYNTSEAKRKQATDTASLIRHTPHRDIDPFAPSSAASFKSTPYQHMLDPSSTTAPGKSTSSTAKKSFLRKGSRKEPSALNRRLCPSPSQTASSGQGNATFSSSSPIKAGGDDGGGMSHFKRHDHHTAGLGAFSHQNDTLKGHYHPQLSPPRSSAAERESNEGIRTRLFHHQHDDTEQKGGVQHSLYEEHESGEVDDQEGKHISASHIYDEEEEEEEEMMRPPPPAVDISGEGMDWRAAREAHRQEVLEFASLERALEEDGGLPSSSSSAAAAAVKEDKAAVIGSTIRGDDGWSKLDDMMEGLGERSSGSRGGGGAAAAGSTTRFSQQRWEAEDYDHEEDARGEEEEPKQEREGDTEEYFSAGPKFGRGLRTKPHHAATRGSTDSQKQSEPLQSSSREGPSLRRTAGLIPQTHESRGDRIGAFKAAALAYEDEEEEEEKELPSSPARRPTDGIEGGCMRCGPGAPIMRAIEAKVEDLDKELKRCKEEASRSEMIRKTHEALLMQAQEKKKEVRAWAEMEQANVVKWSEEQKQLIAKEKKALQRQQSRAAQQDALTKALPTRQERADVEALRATIEKMKLEEEACKKKALATSRRQSALAKELHARIAELEDQVAYLENEKIDAWGRQSAMKNPKKKQGSHYQHPTQRATTAPAAAQYSATQPPSVAVSSSKVRQQQHPLPPMARSQVPIEVVENIVDMNAADVDAENGLKDSSFGTSSSSGGCKRKRSLGGAGAAAGNKDMSEANQASMASSNGDTFEGSTSAGSYPPAPPSSTYDPSKYTTSATPSSSSRPPPCVPSHDHQPAAAAAAGHATEGGEFGSSYGSYASSSKVSSINGFWDAAAKTSSDPPPSRRVQQPRPAVQSEGGAVPVTTTIAGKLVKVYPDGRQELQYANGTCKEIFPDGKSVVRFTNGDIKTTLPASGMVVYYYAHADTKHTTYPDGSEVFEFPSGQVEKHLPDGTKEIKAPGSSEVLFQPPKSASSSSHRNIRQPLRDRN